MFSHTYDTCPLVVCDHEYCYFLPRFGLLHNTTHWGKIEGTRSLVLCLFSYSKHANGRIVFQVLLPFSPVRGELPHIEQSYRLYRERRHRTSSMTPLSQAVNQLHIRVAVADLRGAPVTVRRFTFRDEPAEIPSQTNRDKWWWYHDRHTTPSSSKKGRGLFVVENVPFKRKAMRWITTKTTTIARKALHVCLDEWRACQGALPLSSMAGPLH